MMGFVTPARGRDAGGVGGGTGGPMG
jgi:hypothetical protein